MQPVTRFGIALAILGAALAGCSGGDSNPAGPAADSGKSFTKAEADKAQPVRGGGGSSQEKGK